ncbi:MAG TPA: hypothetical protein PLW86_01880 [Rhodocyclaceae bacterium]|nr:hypothetical protein [Rhodocyclaceae bacterium]
MKLPLQLLVIASLALTHALPAQAQRTPESIIDHTNIAYAPASGKSLTDAEVRAAIRNAATSMGWSIADGQQAQELIGTLIVRAKHTVQVTIRLEPKSYSVVYRDSVNMNYDKSGMTPEDRLLINIRGSSNLGGKEGPVIHPNYNRWVRELVNAINNQIRSL